MLKNKILLVLFALSLSPSFGQTKIIDSLNHAFANTENDTLRLVLAERLSFEWLNINCDSSLKYAGKYSALSEHLGYILNSADAFRLSAFNFTWLGNYPRGLETLFKALEATDENHEFKKHLPSKYLTMMYIPDHLHNLDNYRLYIEGKVHSNMCLLYWITGKAESVFHLEKLQLIAAKTGDDDLKAEAYAFQGIFRSDHPDSALFYLFKSYQLSLKSKTSKNSGPLAEAIGLKYHEMGNHESENTYLKLGLHQNLINENIRNSGFSYLKLSSYFLEVGNIDSVIFFAQKAWSVAKKGNYPDIEESAVNRLSEVYKKTDQRDSAYKYLELLNELIYRNKDTESIRQFENVQNNQYIKEQELLAAKQKYLYQAKLYGILSGFLVIFIFAMVLLRNNRMRKKANTLLQHQKEEIKIQKNNLENALTELKSTQTQLIHKEKMASLGELTAGIAHEIQNPLNFVNNFSEVNNELIDELKEQLTAGTEASVQLAIEIANDIKQNLEKINHHGKRADAIVKGMLQHSRTSSGTKEPTDINVLADEYLRLSYHGLRAKDKSFNADFKTELDASLPKIKVIPQDMGRVLLNLINNAFYAVSDRAKQNENGYKPEVTVITKNLIDKIEISVKDNGNGIPESVKDKIFQPFFTTKPTGQGTGLGLSLSYDIIKAHGGSLLVESKENEFTSFTISIPV